jgi:prolipoprotein diacylglyceryltransferase
MIELMESGLFVFTLAVGFALLLAWSFKALPRERWQIMASVPVSKDDSGHWRGLNLTFYGFFSASAYAVAIAILFILMGSLAVPAAKTLAVVAVTLLLCMPASKLIARTVEKKAYTFTVGGASFVGAILVPFIIFLVNGFPGSPMDPAIPVVPALAAISIAYALGEGMGRLACISFGCCYGKPLSLCHPLVERAFSELCFTFSGKTKKIAYASGMDGQKVVPIQALTSTLYVGTALVSILLFMHSMFVAAYVIAVLVTQGWRAFSETLRADFRGDGRISAYQVMALVAAVYALLLALLLPHGSIGPPDLPRGLHAIWSPEFILLLQGLWLMIFSYTGRSKVTGSTLALHVFEDRI